VTRSSQGLVLAALITLTLFVTAGAVIVFVPVLDCKECQLLIKIEEVLRHETQTVDVNGQPQIVLAPTPKAGSLPKPG
jgi:hypothetical protein